MFEHKELEDILQEFLENYVKEFGEKKAIEIHEKTMTSNKFSGLISQSKYRHIPINAKVILNCMNEIPYFIFSRGQTQALAGLFILYRWCEEVNLEQNLLTSNQIKNIAFDILNTSSKTYY